MSSARITTRSAGASSPAAMLIPEALSSTRTTAVTRVSGRSRHGPRSAVLTWHSRWPRVRKRPAERKRGAALAPRFCFTRHGGRKKSRRHHGQIVRSGSETDIRRFPMTTAIIEGNPCPEGQRDDDGDNRHELWLLQLHGAQCPCSPGRRLVCDRSSIARTIRFHTTKPSV